MANAPGAVAFTVSRWDHAVKKCTSKYLSAEPKETFNNQENLLNSIIVSDKIKIVAQDDLVFHGQEAKILQLEDEAKTNSFLILTFYKSEDFYVLILHTFPNKSNISEGKKLFGQILSSVKLKWK